MGANSGYVGWSMSVRAADAYDSGEMPASKLAKRLGVPIKAIRTVLRPTSWHHTSKHFNATDFYTAPESDDTETILDIAKHCGPKQRKSFLRLYAGLRNESRLRDWSYVCKKPKRYSVIMEHKHLERLLDGKHLSPANIAAAQKEYDEQQAALKAAHLERAIAEFDSAKATAKMIVTSGLSTLDRLDLTRSGAWINRANNQTLEHSINLDGLYSWLAYYGFRQSVDDRCHFVAAVKWEISQ